MSKKYIDKLTQGKIPTSGNLSSGQEPLRSSDLQKVEGIGTFTNGLGDVRVIGNLSDFALFSQNSSTPPMNHPYRNRKLTQQVNFFGGDVVCEGTFGSITGGNTFNTGGVSTYHISSGQLLWLTSPKGNASLGVYEVASSTGSGVTINGTFPQVGNDYHFVIYEPNPVQLMQYSNEDEAGKETVFLTTLPPNWPCWVHPFTDKKEGIALGVPFDYVTHQGAPEIQKDHTKERLLVPITNTGTNPIFEEDRFVVLGTDFGPFLIIEVEFDPDQDIEVLHLSPCHDVILDDFETKVGTTVAYIPIVQEVLDNDSRLNENLLSSVRVKNLISGSDITGSFEDASNAYLSEILSVTKNVNSIRAQAAKSAYGTYAPARARDLGVNLVLFPAKADGTANLERPIFPDTKVVIDPSVEEEQSIHVNYKEGVITLSHAPSDGSDINPDAFYDDLGRVRLFAAFFSFNGASSPVSAAELSARLPANDVNPLTTTLGYKVGGNDPVDNDAWVFDLTEGTKDEEYHANEDFISGGGHKRKVALGKGDGGRVDVRFQTRDIEQGSIHLGALGFGALGEDDSTNQIFVVPDAGNKYIKGSYADPLDLEGKADFRIMSGHKVLEVLFPSEIEIDGTNKELNLILNSDELSLEFNEDTYDVDTFSAALEGLIVNEGLTSGIDFEVSVSNTYKDGKRFLRLKASHYLEVLSGSMNTALDLSVGEVINPDIRLGLGFDGDTYAEIVGREQSGIVEVQAEDVVVEGKASLVDAFDFINRTFSYAVLGMPSGRKEDERQAFELVGDVSDYIEEDHIVFKAQGVLKYPNKIEEPSHRGKCLRTFTSGDHVTIDFSDIEEGDVYYVYYDSVIDSFEKVGLGDIQDLLFEEANVGVPLYIVIGEDTGEIAKIVDVRDFNTSLISGATVTVGATQGRYSSLLGAILRNNHLGSVGKAESFSKDKTIRLVEDYEWNFTVEGSTEITSDLIIDGGGHKISLVTGSSPQTTTFLTINNGSSLTLNSLALNRDTILSAVPVFFIGVWNSSISQDPFKSPEVLNSLYTKDVTFKGSYVSGSATPYTSFIQIFNSKTLNPYGNSCKIYIEGSVLENVLVRTTIEGDWEFEEVFNQPVEFYLNSSKIIDSQVNLGLSKISINDVYATNRGTDISDSPPTLTLHSCSGNIHNLTCDVYKDALRILGSKSRITASKFNIRFSGLLLKASATAILVEDGVNIFTDGQMFYEGWDPLLPKDEISIGSADIPSRDLNQGDAVGIDVSGGKNSFSNLYLSRFPTSNRRSYGIVTGSSVEGNSFSNIILENPNPYNLLPIRSLVHGNTTERVLEGSELAVAYDPNIQTVFDSSKQPFALNINGNICIATPTESTVQTFATNFNTSLSPFGATFEYEDTPYDHFVIKTSDPLVGVEVQSSELNFPMGFSLTGGRLRIEPIHTEVDISSIKHRGPIIDQVQTDTPVQGSWTILGTQLRSENIYSSTLYEVVPFNELEIRFFDDDINEDYHSSVVLTPDDPAIVTWNDNTIIVALPIPPNTNPLSFVLTTDDISVSYKII